MKLLAFLPCEKIIISENENVATLIAILQELTAQIPSGMTVPENALAPMTWWIFVMWLREAEDDPTLQHKASVSLVFPSAKRITLGEMTFDLGVGIVRNMVQTIGFPISEAGSLSLVLDLDGEEKTTYPLSVKYILPRVPTA